MTRYFLSDYLKDTFGTKVYKLSLQSGCTCPNRDGTLGLGGCSFCSEGGSGDFASPLLPVRDQIKAAKKLVDAKFPRRISESDRKYIAYFQSFTNTYGDTEKLCALYEEAISFPEIAALSVATRPDCLSGEMLFRLSEMNRAKPVWIELGLQTSDDKTAESFNRCYKTEVFGECWNRLKSAGLEGIVHIILGLPGESEPEMLETAGYLARLDPPPDGIKISNLQILKGTKLGEEYLKKPFKLLSLDEYAELVCKCLDILPETTVIHRITGDPPKKILIAPGWCADKKTVINTLNKKLNRFC